MERFLFLGVGLDQFFCFFAGGVRGWKGGGLLFWVVFLGSGGGRGGGVGLTWLGPPAKCPFTVSFLLGSPTKKVLVSNLKNLEDLEDFWGVEGRKGGEQALLGMFVNALVVVFVVEPSTCRCALMGFGRPPPPKMAQGLFALCWFP